MLHRCTEPEVIYRAVRARGTILSTSLARLLFYHLDIIAREPAAPRCQRPKNVYTVAQVSTHNPLLPFIEPLHQSSESNSISAISSPSLKAIERKRKRKGSDTGTRSVDCGLSHLFRYLHQPHSHIVLVRAGQMFEPAQ